MSVFSKIDADNAAIAGKNLARIVNNKPSLLRDRLASASAQNTAGDSTDSPADFFGWLIIAAFVLAFVIAPFMRDDAPPLDDGMAHIDAMIDEWACADGVRAACADETARQVKNRRADNAR